MKTGGLSRPEVPRPPWFTFWLGGAITLGVAGPLLALVAHLCRDRSAGHEDLTRALLVGGALTALPLLLVGGGVARWVSDGVHLDRRRRGLGAALQLALLGAALALVLATAFGLPERRLTMLAWLGLGALAAAPAGPCVAWVTEWRVRRALRRRGRG